MKVGPIKRYPGPGIPTRRIIDDHPELLKLVPKRWRSNPAVLTALTALCSVCLAGQVLAEKESRPTVSCVSPVFEHGKGRGTFGCSAINPPIFLSEDEARQVITDEAARAGIRLEPDQTTLANFDMPATSKGWPPKTEPQTQKGPLALDGTDSRRKVSYEFVSGQDFEKWLRDPKEPIALSYEVNLLGTAKTLRGSLAAARPAGSYGVFYDPAVGWQDVSDEASKSPGYYNLPPESRTSVFDATAKRMATDELRAQVRDFIKWLKAQGVI